MNDPYFNTGICVERLYQEYVRHKRLVIAMDFDDTLFDYHEKGYTFSKIIDIVKECQKLDFFICVFTGSPPEKYGEIRAYLGELGIWPASINENPFPMPFGNHGKMYFNILLDDRAGIGQAYEILRKTLDKIAQ